MISQSVALGYPARPMARIVKPMVSEDEQAKSLGSRIKESIGDRNPTLIARQAHVSAGWLSQLINEGIAEPSAFRLYRLAKVLDEDYEYLLTGAYDDQPQTPEDMERWLHKTHREQVRHMRHVLLAQQAAMAGATRRSDLTPEQDALVDLARADTQSAADQANPESDDPQPEDSAA